MDRDVTVRRQIEIDAEFALMADDSWYLAEVDLITEEFAVADWEAFQQGESAGFPSAATHFDGR